MRRHPRAYLKSILTIASLTLASQAALASGFRVPEVSTAGTGLSSAIVANASELGALTYNPAAMSYHKGNNVVGGLAFLALDMSVDPTTGTPNDSQVKSFFTIPNVYFSGDLQNGWWWGLGINSPFGLETNWPQGTFAGLGTLQPSLSRIKMVNINPNISTMIGPNTSVAFGVDFYELKELVFSAYALPVAGSGDGIGFNVAIMHKAGAWTFGGSYRSSVDTDITGAASLAPATASLEFPDLLQVGASYQVSPAVTVEFDVEFTGWSSFDTLTITAPVLGASSPITSTNNWEDTTTYRLGLTYTMSPDTRLWFGYSLDETPQPDAFFSPRVPGADRQLFTIGAAHDMGGWELEAAYMFVDVDTRTVNNSAAWGGPGTEANGTSVYNGTYNSDVSILSIGVSKSF